MKKLKSTLAILVMAFGLMITTNACRDPCKNVECNNGTCDDGTCICDTGYEGENCETAMRAKFLGQWIGSDNCVVGFTYTMTFTESAQDVQRININNFGGYGTNLNIYATASGTSLTIPSQQAGGATWSGSGSISGGNLTFNYAVTDADGESESCSGNFTRP